MGHFFFNKKDGDNDGVNFEVFNSDSRKNKDIIDYRGIKIDDFTGLGTPKDFLEWEHQVEKIS